MKVVKKVGNWMVGGKEKLTRRTRRFVNVGELLPNRGSFRLAG
jgi:hypothetical protein